MTTAMYKYKGTKQLVKVGDNVNLSNRYAVQFGYSGGVVVGLAGFITVQLPNGDKVDFDSRSVTFRAQ
jgi:hypothetical protein